MRFHVEVWHTTWALFLFFFTRRHDYCGSQYEVEDASQLWNICNWAAERGHTIYVWKLEDNQ